MKLRERLAWLLVVVLTASATALWWNGRDRYEFRASSNGAIVWKLDRQSGKAWLVSVRDKVWKPVADATPDFFDTLPDGFELEAPPLDPNSGRTNQAATR